MRKLLLLATLCCLLVLSAGNTFAQPIDPDFVNALFFSSNQYYAPTDDTLFMMLTGAQVNTTAYAVYMKFQGGTQRQLFRVPGWDDVSGDFQYVRTFPSPLPTDPVWGQTFTFYIDLNSNASLDPGEPEAYWTIDTGDISQMPLVQNVDVTGDFYHPTISWAPPSDGVDNYKVRFFPLNPDGKVNMFILLDEMIITYDGQPMYEISYPGDALMSLSGYGVAVEAWDGGFDGRTPNRSRYTVKNVIPEPDPFPWEIFYPAFIKKK